MRAYELMVIIDGDVEDAGVKAVNAKIAELIEADGGSIAKTDLGVVVVSLTRSITRTKASTSSSRS